MITAVDLDADSVIVDFDAGPEGGVSVDNFTVTCTSSDGGATQDATDTDSPITVDSLTHGKTYTCTVHASNVIGDSAESDPTGAFLAGTVPSAPSISSVTRGTNSAIVTISNNGNGGDTIHAYTVKCTSSNGGVTRTRTAETV